MKIKLHVREDAGAGNPIVLLHGIFGDGTQWRSISRMLMKDHRVIVVDMLGHGKSPRPEGAKYTSDEHAIALRNTLMELRATENLTVVGYSMGGAVALSYSAMFPDNVAQLCLLSTPFYLKSDQMISMNYTNSLMFTKVSLVLYRLGDSILRNKKSADKITAFANDSAQFHKMIGAHDNELDGEIVRRSLKEMVWDFDFAGNLAKVTAPTTIYAGKKDLFIVQGQLYALKQIKPYADIERLDLIKVDHMLVQNLPREITSLITRNLNQLLHVGADEGSGDVLVLLHGIESSSSYWTHLVPALSEHHRVISIDLLGFGMSPKPSNIAYSLDDQVNALHRTLESMDIKKFTLAGHSLGSIVALAYSAQYSDRVASLIMFSPVIISEAVKSDRDILKRVDFINKVSDTSFMLTETAQAIGDKRIKKYIPFVRSLDNSIKDQDSHHLAHMAKEVPIAMVYGQNDPLVDKKLLHNLTGEFKNSSVVEIPGGFHNFPMFEPHMVLEAIDKDLEHENQPKPADRLPATFLKQIVRLSAPILMVKSVLYILAGGLLFTDFAPYVLAMGLVAYVVSRGVGIIKGAFTLKNEEIAYIGYVLLGLGMVAAGYYLIKHPETSLHITALIIGVLVILSGLIRVIVGLMWTKSKNLRMSLLLTGSALVIVGFGVLLGNLISIYVVVYSIAIYLLARGIQFGIYSTGSVVMAYVRGFNKQ